MIFISRSVRGEHFAWIVNVMNYPGYRYAEYEVRVDTSNLASLTREFHGCRHDSLNKRRIDQFNFNDKCVVKCGYEVRSIPVLPLDQYRYVLYR